MPRQQNEPEYSCGELDSAIQAIERARTIHDKLREWGREGWDEVDSLRDQVAELEKKAESLQQQIDRMECESHPDFQ